MLDAAVDLFWERGYRATTTRELEAALGITQSSIYNAFGSKQQLMLLAIDRYETRMEADILGLLAGPEPGLDRVERFFEALGDWVRRTDHRGCLVVNLMATVTDDALVARVVEYREKIRLAMRAPLGAVFDDALADQRSELLVAAVLGVHVAARTGRPGEVDAMLDGVCGELKRWRAAA